MLGTWKLFLTMCLFTKGREWGRCGGRKQKMENKRYCKVKVIDMKKENAYQEWIFLAPKQINGFWRLRTIVGSMVLYHKEHVPDTGWVWLLSLADSQSPLSQIDSAWYPIVAICCLLTLFNDNFWRWTLRKSKAYSYNF